MTNFIVVSENKAIEYQEELWPFFRQFLVEYPYLSKDSDENLKGILKSILTMKGILLIIGKDKKKIVAASFNSPFKHSNLTKHFRKFMYNTETKPDDFIFSNYTFFKSKHCSNKTLNFAVYKEIAKQGYKGIIIPKLIRPVNDPKAPEGYTVTSMGAEYLNTNVQPVSAIWVDKGDEVPTEKVFEYYVRWV